MLSMVSRADRRTNRHYFLVGWEPFHSPDVLESFRMIDDWKRTFYIPVDVQMSPSARHLILRYVQHRPVPDASPVTTPFNVPHRPLPSVNTHTHTTMSRTNPHTCADCHAPSLIQDPETRLGRHGGAAEIKAHPFFLPIDFANLKWMPGPLKVPLRSDDDTSRFPIDILPQGDNCTSSSSCSYPLSAVSGAVGSIVLPNLSQHTVSRRIVADIVG